MKKFCAVLLVFTLLSYLTVGVAFADSSSDWAQEKIENLKATEYFNAQRFTSFQKPITRLEFVYFAARLFEVMSSEEIQPDPGISFKEKEIKKNLGIVPELVFCQFLGSYKTMTQAYTNYVEKYNNFKDKL